MKEVCFEKYDLAFRDLAKDGDILVSGCYVFSTFIPHHSSLSFDPVTYI